MRFLLIFILAASSLVAAAPPAPQIVRLLNQHSGKYITVGTTHTESGGTELVQQPKNDTPAQQWKAVVIPPEPGTSNPAPRFMFVSLTEEKALGIRYQSSITGASACLWPPRYGPTEVFRVLPGTDGWVYLENLTSRKVLAVLGGSSDDGAKVVQWNQDKSEDQLWKIEPVK